MRLSILRTLLGLALSTLLPAAEPAFVVVKPVVNLFRGTSLDKDVVSQALLGARVVELERQEGWLRIKGEDDYPGWIEAGGVRTLGAAERYPASLEPGRAVEVDALAAHIYREPDVTKHAPILTAPFGVRLERVNGGKDTPRWLEVRLPDRRLGWIQQGDVRTDLKPLSLEASLELAKRFIGITYTWGGTSSFGFDCSGYTQMLLRSRGILMPRDANIQAEWPGLVAVPERGKLAPGDLLFFGKDLAHITHTGMFLGQDRFIHDTPKDRPGIQISSLADPAWSKLLVAMRRPK